MANHNELGKFGEEIAVEYLRKAGYEILATNWVFEKAEIDILAKQDNLLAVVEVKTRSRLDLGLPQDFVSPKKIKLLVKAVNEYLISNDLDCETRFDIMAISKEGSKFEIEHLQDAFYHF
ncbi:MAG: endonuclease [Flavobacterium sp.]|nr:MAG: endonuclease [Flavobacterium sp.]